MTTQQKKTRLEKKGLELWKQACAKKWGTKCEICGKDASTFHHFIYKSASNALKFDVENGVPICRDCHFKIHRQKKNGFMALRIRDRRGKKWSDYIQSKDGVLINRTIGWLEEQIKGLDIY